MELYIMVNIPAVWCKITFEFQLVTLPKGMPVRDVYLMGVNINSLIWGMSPHYYQCAPYDATISCPCGGQPYQDNTTTPNSRKQDHEDVFKTRMTVKNINSKQIIKWSDLISVFR